MSFKAFAFRGALIAISACALSGCLAATVAGATVGVAGAAVGVAAKATAATAKGAGAVVGAVIP